MISTASSFALQIPEDRDENHGTILEYGGHTLPPAEPMASEIEFVQKNLTPKTVIHLWHLKDNRYETFLFKLILQKFLLEGSLAWHYAS